MCDNTEDYTRVCKKCGESFNAYDPDTDYASYVICWDCNNEFWDKWYNLPKVRCVAGKFLRTEAHDSLIKEYCKEDHFHIKGVLK